MRILSVLLHTNTTSSNYHRHLTNFVVLNFRSQSLKFSHGEINYARLLGKRQGDKPTFIGFLRLIKLIRAVNIRNIDLSFLQSCWLLVLFKWAKIWRLF
jgi:hypothetical protein